ncbi:MAG: translation initiation factor IF-2, partial [Firmicutes bacterium]|nr:translation initiation factor IF-2 [Bacillota bacterium]
KELNLIIKANVQGSVGALEQSLEKLRNENAKVNIIHTGVGAINESDVMLAGTSNAVIIGFNVRPSAAVQAQADADGVEIRTYRIIYEIIDDIEAALKGMLNPTFKEVVLGSAEVRETFKVPGVGLIAGAYVTDGKITRTAKLRLVREGIVIHEGEVASLKRFKDDAKEVASGFECGIGIEKFNDIKVGDVIEAFEMQEVKAE